MNMDVIHKNSATAQQRIATDLFLSPIGLSQPLRVAIQPPKDAMQ